MKTEKLSSENVNANGVNPLLAAFYSFKRKLKTISFNFYFRRRWAFTTPYLSIGWDKQTPFADWRVDIDFAFFYWMIQIDFDNTYKYYPKYEKTDSN